YHAFLAAAKIEQRIRRIETNYFFNEGNRVLFQRCQIISIRFDQSFDFLDSTLIRSCPISRKGGLKRLNFPSRWIMIGKLNMQYDIALVNDLPKEFIVTNSIVT